MARVLPRFLPLKLIAVEVISMCGALSRGVVPNATEHRKCRAGKVLGAMLALRATFAMHVCAFALPTPKGLAIVMLPLESALMSTTNTP